jgi:ribosomal protein S13
MEGITRLEGGETMKNRKVWLASIIAVVLLATVAVGVALADTPATTALQSGQGIAQTFLGNLASALGISQSTLTSALNTAATNTVNQEVASGKITQQQASKILARISSGKFSFMGMGFGKPGSVAGSVYGHRRPRGAMGGFMIMKPLASALGMTSQNLMSSLRSGQTISDLASAKNLTVAQLESTILTSIQTQLQQAVTNGKMTQAQETQIYSKLQQNINSGAWITQLQNRCQKHGHQQSGSSTPQTSSNT